MLQHPALAQDSTRLLELVWVTKPTCKRKCFVFRHSSRVPERINQHQGTTAFKYINSIVLIGPGTYHVIELLLSTKFQGTNFQMNFLDLDSEAGDLRQGALFWHLAHLRCRVWRLSWQISLKEK